MTYDYHPEALAEYSEAAVYYARCAPGLGADFVREIEVGIGSILEAPERSRRIEGEVRRHLVRRFPYGIHYVIRGELVMIIAVMHQSREPNYWVHRLPT